MGAIRRTCKIMTSKPWCVFPCERPANSPHIAVYSWASHDGATACVGRILVDLKYTGFDGRNGVRRDSAVQVHRWICQDVLKQCVGVEQTWKGRQFLQALKKSSGDRPMCAPGSTAGIVSSVNFAISLTEATSSVIIIFQYVVLRGASQYLFG